MLTLPEIFGSVATRVSSSHHRYISRHSPERPSRSLALALAMARVFTPALLGFSPTHRPLFSVFLMTASELRSLGRGAAESRATCAYPVQGCRSAAITYNICVSLSAACSACQSQPALLARRPQHGGPPGRGGGQRCFQSVSVVITALTYGGPDTSHELSFEPCQQQGHQVKLDWSQVSLR